MRNRVWPLELQLIRAEKDNSANHQVGKGGLPPLFFMKKKQTKKEKASSKPEKITGEEALSRVKKFAERKEKIIAFIIESKN